eukprot:m.1076068 g.1076068  ORF g.1076068 m.1076068 type:complete len:284 (-) comp24247_c0_seq3:2038-2889(-)
MDEGTIGVPDIWHVWRANRTCTFEATCSSALERGCLLLQWTLSHLNRLSLKLQRDHNSTLDFTTTWRAFLDVAEYSWNYESVADYKHPLAKKNELVQRILEYLEFWMSLYSLANREVQYLAILCGQWLLVISRERQAVQLLGSTSSLQRLLNIGFAPQGGHVPRCAIKITCNVLLQLQNASDCILDTRVMAQTFHWLRLQSGNCPDSIGTDASSYGITGLHHMLIHQWVRRRQPLRDVIHRRALCVIACDGISWTSLLPRDDALLAGTCQLQLCCCRAQCHSP